MVDRIERRTDRAVSTVLGTVLIVAVVVVLAATIGAYAFTFNDQTNEPAPQVAITTEYDERTSGDGQSLTVQFRSGDKLTTDTVSLDLQGATAVDPSGSDDTAVIDGDQLEDQAGTRIVAGERVEIDASTTTVDTSAGESLDLSDATLRLIWNPADPEIDHSEVIWRWEA